MKGAGEENKEGKKSVAKKKRKEEGRWLKKIKRDVLRR